MLAKKSKTEDNKFNHVEFLMFWRRRLSVIFQKMNARVVNNAC
jgi:hypothetical protein